MNQYMSDSSFTDLDPRDLILDHYMQARDPELIKNNKAREAQIKKQEEQDKDILDDLLNGGEIKLPIVVFEVDGKLERIHHPMVAKDAQVRLAEIREAVLKEVAGSRVSKDQFCRLFDLAIDFCEEPPDLGLEGAEAIRSIFERFGAQAKVSSIHVNGWFGQYDKLSMARLYASERWGVSIEDTPESYLFCGDSPNDEPMFAFFPLSCGVANVHAFRGQMTHLPTYVATHEGGEGFAEIVDKLLACRQGSA